MMMKTLRTLTLMAIVVATPAAAHEVWVERDGNDSARIYLGEPAEVTPENGDPEFRRLKAPVAHLAASSAPLALTRRANHIEAAVRTSGDVRVRDDNVFAPWKTDAGIQGAVFYARAGRSEPKAALDLELVPTAAESDRLTLLFRDRPLAKTKVTFISPDKWTKVVETDANGQVEAPNRGAGRYVISATHGESGPVKLRDQEVSSLSHVTTLTFVR